MNTFPIMAEYDHDTRKYYRGIEIPWALIAPHNEQALKNHCDQSLIRLAQRGGLSRSEACAIIEDRDWESMKTVDADNKLAGHIAAFISAKLQPLPPGATPTNAAGSRSVSLAMGR